MKLTYFLYFINFLSLFIVFKEMLNKKATIKLLPNVPQSKLHYFDKIIIIGIVVIIATIIQDVYKLFTNSLDVYNFRIAFRFIVAIIFYWTNSILKLFIKNN